jgi:hypothetical protein
MQARECGIESAIGIGSGEWLGRIIATFASKHNNNTRYFLRDMARVQNQRQPILLYPTH